MIEDLIINCRTTCGCGPRLIQYTKQTETTHYLLTCKSLSNDYDHPLLIAIDKNSPVFEKAGKWDRHSRTIEAILKLKGDIDTLYDYEIVNLLPKYLLSIQKDRAAIQRLNQNKELEQENKLLKEKIRFLTEDAELNNEIDWTDDGQRECPTHKQSYHLYCKKCKDEIKQLKEEIHKLQQLWHEECDDSEYLKQKLEKINELVNSSKPFEYIVFQIHQELDSQEKE